MFQHHPGPQTQRRRDDEGQSLRGTTGHPEAQESLSGPSTVRGGSPWTGGWRPLPVYLLALRRHGSTMLFHAIHIYIVNIVMESQDGLVDEEERRGCLDWPFKRFLSLFFSPSSSSPFFHLSVPFSIVQKIPYQSIYSACCLPTTACQMS